MVGARRKEKQMGAVTTTVIAIAGILLGWLTIEVACRPCLQRGRSSIFKSLNPDYDPDDELDASSSRNRKQDEDEEEEADEEAAAAASSIEDDEKKPLKK